LLKESLPGVEAGVRRRNMRPTRPNANLFTVDKRELTVRKTRAGEQIFKWGLGRSVWWGLGAGKEGSTASSKSDEVVISHRAFLTEGKRGCGGGYLREDHNGKRKSAETKKVVNYSSDP